MRKIDPILQLEAAALDVQACMRDLKESFDSYMWAHQAATATNVALANKNDELQATVNRLRHQVGRMTQGLAA